MGIRFDRNTVRPTNGPMIFFSDPSAEADLGEEIRGAISSCLSFYAYRRPGDMMVSFGSSEGVVRGIGDPGFVISFFNPEEPPVTIPYRPRPDMIRSSSVETPLPQESTSREEHEREIKIIQEKLRETGHGKIVAARVLCGRGNVDVAASFTELCRKFPDSFVFAFSTPLTGCWIGATPEVLLESGRESGLRTMALAGTRPVGENGEWDEKNIEEQGMVADYIMDCLSCSGMSVRMGQTCTRPAGNVEHICTPIYATPLCDINPKALEKILGELSPTPALCGLPKAPSLKTIITTEKFQRGCYGGFCGPFRSSSDFNFFVTLRCAQLGHDRFAVFAGGGITLRSNPADEWMETELKASNILSNLVTDRG